MAYSTIAEEKTINQCLIQQLSVLKESSLEAVDSPDLKCNLKSYMHIERNIQKEFWNIVQNVADSETAQLILLCGNVGDGKSHILSHYLQNEPETMKKFHIHNDSTASVYKTKPAIETLKEVLACFSDEQINYNKEKWIVAINLGTLTNFLEADNEKKFTKLKEYIEQQKILENDVIMNKENSHENFHYVNFSDYHLYTLKKEGVQSEYIKTILERITDTVPENVFYTSYEAHCSNCESKDKCPVKANFELLFSEVLQNRLIECIIEAIIKGKIILSTRAIFNIFYELLVSRRYINASSLTVLVNIKNLNENEYVNALLPNILFSSEDNDGLFLSLNKCDPLNIKNEEVDKFVINVMNNDDILHLIDEKLPEVSSKLDRIKNVDFSDKSKVELKKSCLKLYIRSSKLFYENSELRLKDELYTQFIKDLYNWNKAKTSQLKSLYDVVIKAALKWNGEAVKDTINLNIGKPQTKYILSQEVKINPYVKNIQASIQEELEKFSEEIKLEFIDSKSNKFHIFIDFNLYKLIYGIQKGYRPNKKDKNLYIKFEDFVEQIEDSGSQDEKIIIKGKNGRSGLQYELSYSQAFGYSFEVKQ